MAAFPCQQHAVDFDCLPDVFPFDLPPPSAQQQAGDLPSASACLPCYPPTFDAINDVFPADISTVNAGTSSISASTTATPAPESSSAVESGRAVPSVDNKITSSSSAQRSEAAPKTQCPVQKKRKDRQRCNSDAAQSKDSAAGKSRKLRKRSRAMEKEAPTGYVLVRARRGEATDSHSLAERVRREKIRERMKVLQELVPGCDKVVGKALLLEEIINYVQSLQNQVEFLSMKLASMDPMFCDFGLHFGDYMTRTEGYMRMNMCKYFCGVQSHEVDRFEGITLQKLENMSPGLPNVQRTSHTQLTAFADATNSYPVQDSSVPFSLHGGGPGLFPQDNGSNFVKQLGDHRQSLLNQVEFDNMSFH